jgi:tetratricopeptide (TPR) repeat protein
MRTGGGAQPVAVPVLEIESTIAPGAITALLDELARTPSCELLDASPRELGPGSVLGRFELLREIGRGGCGVVYEARDRELGRLVALKAIRPGNRSAAELRSRSLRGEAEAAAKLGHPNIVTLYDLGTSDGSPYLVLELLRGETLDARLARGPLAVRQAVRVALAVARALAHAHGQGVIHRDLKPSNVFLTRAGEVKVLDFGLAFIFGSHVPLRGGTPAYMAPEQRRRGPVDERADVFALGVMLREMLGPAAAAPGEGARARALRALADRMTDEDPAQRPRGAGVVEAGLLVLDVERPAPLRAEAPAPARSPRFRRRHAAASGALAVLVGAVTAWLAWRGLAREEAAPPAPLPALGAAAAPALPSGDGARPAGRQGHAASAEVNAQYLLGRQFYHRSSEDGWRRAVDAYEKALALDPSFAPAWAGLAVPLYYLSDRASDLSHASAIRERAVAAAERAVALAPGLAEAYAARGALRFLVRFDWQGARSDLERAVALDPRDGASLRRYGLLLADLGRLPDAIAALRSAVEVEPLATPSWNELGELYLASGEYALARQAFRRALEIAPEAAVSLRFLAVASLLEGRAAAAREEFERCRLDVDRLWGAALSEHALGNAEASQRALDLLVAGYAHVDAFGIARVHAFRGDRDAAFEWLDRALAQRDDGVDGVKTSPLLAGLRRDPRFAALLARMGLPADP